MQISLIIVLCLCYYSDSKNFCPKWPHNLYCLSFIWVNSLKTILFWLPTLKWRQTKWRNWQRLKCRMRNLLNRLFVAWWVRVFTRKTRTRWLWSNKVLPWFFITWKFRQRLDWKSLCRDIESEMNYERLLLISKHYHAHLEYQNLVANPKFY